MRSPARSGLILGVALACLAYICSGCGGGGSGRSLTGGSGSLRVTVVFPSARQAATGVRAIPVLTQSVTVDVFGPVSRQVRTLGPLLAHSVIQRPSDATQASGTIAGLPLGTVEVVGDARPNADGTGSSLATASAFVDVQAGANLVELDLQGTVGSIMYVSTPGRFSFDEPAKISTVDPVTAAVLGGFPLSDLAFSHITEVERNPANGLLYAGLGRADGRLITINPANGTVNVIGDNGMGKSLTALEFGPDGTLYAGTENADFGTVNPTTGALNIISNINFLCTLAGLSFSPSGVLYGCEGGDCNGYLVTINPATGATSVITNTGFGDLAGLEFGPDGTLYAGIGGSAFSPANPGELYKLDPATGTPTLIGSTGRRVISGITF